MIMRAFGVTVSALALASCAAGPPPEIATAPPALPDAYYYSADADAEANLASLLPVADPAFNSLADYALAASPTLAEAMARVEQARAGASRASAELFPSLGVDSSVTGRRTNPAQISSNLPPALSIDTERVAYAANLTTRWDLDIFGRLRAGERAALARVDAAEAAARGVQIALISEIAGSVIDWRTLQLREAELREDLASAEALVRLATDREAAGLAPGFDAVRAASSADGSRRRLTALERERVQLIGRLVTLAAQPAADVRTALQQPFAEGRLPSAPSSLPSQLLTNRPDVLAAAASLAAEDAELAATARRRFPAFNLSSALGLLSFGISDLFDNESLVGSLAGTVSAPLLDFGRIQAEIDGAAAEKVAAFERYRASVYTALGDAETGYGLVAAADGEAAAAQREADSLQQAARLANSRFDAGLDDFLTVLDARRAADAAGARAAAAWGRARRARIVLWQALGGSDLP